MRYLSSQKKVSPSDISFWVCTRMVNNMLVRGLTASLMAFA